MAPFIGLGVRLGGACIAQQAIVVPPWYGALTPRAAYLAHPDEYTDVAEWGDDTGNGLVLTSSPGASEIAAFNATGVNSKPGIMFASAKNLQGASAADWAFLHSGEYGIAGELYLAGPLNTQNVLSTYTGAAMSGFRLLYNGTTRTFWALEYNASGPILSCQTATNALGVPPNTHKFYFRVSRSAGTPDARLYVDGVQLQTANYTGANLVGSPAQALKLAQAPGNGSNFINGGIRSLLLFPDGAADPTDVFAALSAASQRRTRVIRCLGDSITVNTSSFRCKLAMRFARSADQRVTFQGSAASPLGNFPLVDKRHDGVSGENISQISARVAGYSGLTCTDVVDLSGTNDMGGTAAAALAAKDAHIDAMLATHTGADIWVLAIPYGTGSGNNTLVGTAGTFNAGLPALCASKGSRVHFVDIHSGAYAYNPAIHSSDTTGHPTVAGGDATGNTLAVAMGVGGD